MKRKLLIALTIASVISLAPTSVFASTQTTESTPISQSKARNGWVSDGYDWYYYKNGQAITGWLNLDNNWYFFKPSTKAMVTGKALIDGSYYHFYDNGIMATGWVELKFSYGKEWRYYGSNGAMHTNSWVKSGEDWYYLNVDGNIVDYPCVIGGSRYHFNSDGTLYTGWYKNGLFWEYYTLNGLLCKSWLNDNGSWYYFDASGDMVTGTYYINNVEYLFNKNGAMHTGWTTELDYYKNPYWVYYDESGAKYKDQWLLQNGNWYNLNPYGKMQIGLVNLKTDNGYFYFDQSGIMKTGWQKINGKWHHFSSSGKANTGWFKDNNTWYYLLKNGSAVTGTYYIDGNRHYFDSNGAWQYEF